jgi:CMP-N,N'-diacetyllegionaminic acid synthase
VDTTRSSIDAAQRSAAFDDLVVSTDDNEIAAIAAARNCKVVRRPPELSQSDTEMLPVVQHAFEQYRADIIVLLQPTSPFRTATDINSAIKLHTDKEGDSVISVTEAPKNNVFEIGHAARLHPARREVVVPNGAIYLITAEHLLNKGDWYSGIAYAYKMPKERSIDIDTKIDFEYARLLVKQQIEAEKSLRYANEDR